ncbi:MAG: hypothetical protein Q9163_005213 [Psora crenata]
MSKSHDSRSRINMNDTEDDIAAKIRLALTDSITGITYDPINRPGVSNLLELMSQFDGETRSADRLARIYSCMSMREFKANAARALIDGLASFRERYHLLMHANKARDLEDIANYGAVEAQKQATKTILQIKRKN